MHMAELSVFACISDTKRLCKALSKVMGCAGLKSLSIMHERFNGIGGFSTCKLLFVCLSSLHHWNGEEISEHVRIDIQHLDGFFLGFFSGLMNGVTFLPEELRGS